MRGFELFLSDRATHKNTQDRRIVFVVRRKFRFLVVQKLAKNSSISDWRTDSGVLGADLGTWVWGSPGLIAMMRDNVLFCMWLRQQWLRHGAYGDRVGASQVMTRWDEGMHEVLEKAFMCVLCVL